MRRFERFPMRLALLLSLFIIAASPLHAAPRERQTVEQAVVRLTNYQQSPNWNAPWRMKPPQPSTGTGFLVEPGLILTSAHVVSDSRMLLVHKPSVPEPFIAKVMAVAHDSDLALLQVDDPSFYEGLTPLPFGELPVLQSRVQAYGYPLGGEELSHTAGVVSRIEFGTYVHPGVDSHLLIQTDTAINPGNSGGPVVQEGKVVGVAFQSNPKLNDVGYFIPVPLIQRFLRDLEDGSYDGVPEIGIQTSTLLNRNERAFLGLPEEAGGVHVDRILSRSSAAGVLQADDVLLEIEGLPIDLAGMVHHQALLVDFYIVAEGRQVGETLSFVIWRDHQRQTVALILKPPPFGHEVRNSYDRLPEYLIHGGLVFVALTRNYLQAQEQLHPVLAYEHWYREIEQPNTRRKQRVVLARVLPASSNSGYTELRNFVLDQFNNTPVQSLAHLDSLLRSLPSETEHLVFTSHWNPLPVMLNRHEIASEHDAILQTYGITETKRLHRRTGL